MAVLWVSTAADLLGARPVERASCAEQHVSLYDGPLPPANVVLAPVAAVDEVQRGTLAAVRMRDGMLHFLEH